MTSGRGWATWKWACWEDTRGTWLAQRGQISICIICDLPWAYRCLILSKWFLFLWQVLEYTCRSHLPVIDILRFHLLGISHAWSYMANFKCHTMHEVSKIEFPSKYWVRKSGRLSTSTPFICTKSWCTWISSRHSNTTMNKSTMGENNLPPKNDVHILLTYEAWMVRNFV